jgi:hypothetical protein
VQPATGVAFSMWSTTGIARTWPGSSSGTLTDAGCPTVGGLHLGAGTVLFTRAEMQAWIKGVKTGDLA